MRQARLGQPLAPSSCVRQDEAMMERLRTVPRSTGSRRCKNRKSYGLWLPRHWFAEKEKRLCDKVLALRSLQLAACTTTATPTPMPCASGPSGPQTFANRESIGFLRGGAGGGETGSASWVIGFSSFCLSKWEYRRLALTDWQFPSHREGAWVRGCGLSGLGS